MTAMKFTELHFIMYQFDPNVQCAYVSSCCSVALHCSIIVNYKTESLCAFTKKSGIQFTSAIQYFQQFVYVYKNVITWNISDFIDLNWLNI